MKIPALLILMLPLLHPAANGQKIGLPVYSFADSAALTQSDHKKGNNYYKVFDVEMKAGNGILVEMESSYFVSYVQFVLGDSLYGEPKN